ncbi:MAG: 2-hydroxyacid dehydrogenase [Armatimonadota bacterium]
MVQYSVYVTRRIRNGFRREMERIATVNSWDKDWPVPRVVLLSAIREADGLLCLGDDVIDAEVIRAGRRLRVISTATAGYDHIDLDAARARQITVCHAPGAADTAVADLTLTLMLACARSVVEANRFVHEREWDYWAPYLFEGVELQNSTLGIIGLGRIGLQVAHRALGFGMRVLYYGSRRNEDAEQSLGLQFGSIDNILREADFVSLHLPLLPATHGLIDERRLRLMKPSAFLINMARGAVVNHDALVRALREGWIAGAALDVYHREPIPPDDPLLELPNVIMTPHIGSNTHRAMARMVRMAADQIIQVLNGEHPHHAVVSFVEKRAA